MQAPSLGLDTRANSFRQLLNLLISKLSSWSTCTEITGSPERSEIRERLREEQAPLIMPWGKAMGEFHGITEEMYRAIVAIVDDRLKGVRVSLEDFDRLSQAVAQLAAAQARTEATLERLAQAQARTEQRLEALAVRVDQLAEAQARTEQRLEALAARVDQLAQAQARTEERLTLLEAVVERLAESVHQLATQVGALAENIGYGLEDIARLVLPSYLKQRYGVKVERLERRLFHVDGQVIDVDLYAEGTRDQQRVVVVGEVKARIYGREVGQFQQLLEAVRPLVPAELLPLMFGYFIDLSAMEAAQGEILLIASYQPAVELPPSPAPPPQRRKRRSR